MHFIREAIFKAAAWITGNKVAQRLLRENIRYSQFLIGMGLGDVRLSGEDAAIRLALKISKGPVCIFDVGANRGEYTNLVLRCCPGRRVAIHAFEPSKQRQEVFLKMYRPDRTSILIAWHYHRVQGVHSYSMTIQGQFTLL